MPPSCTRKARKPERSYLLRGVVLHQRGGAENLIKEANNDAGLAAHPSGRFDVNGSSGGIVTVPVEMPPEAGRYMTAFVSAKEEKQLNTEPSCG